MRSFFVTITILTLTLEAQALVCTTKGRNVSPMVADITVSTTAPKLNFLRSGAITLVRGKLCSFEKARRDLPDLIRCKLNGYDLVVAPSKKAGVIGKQALVCK